jgi:hypothetical protein
VVVQTMFKSLREKLRNTKEKIRKVEKII